MFLSRARRSRYNPADTPMIVACRQCGRGVSTEAAVCPHCGAPDPYHGWGRPAEVQPVQVAPPPAARRKRAGRAVPRRGGFPSGLAGMAIIAALVLGAGLVLYKLKGSEAPVVVSNDGYPVGGAPAQTPEKPSPAGAPGDRMRRLEGHYLTGVGQLISEPHLKRDNPQIEMMLLHEMANCPLLVKAMKYYLPLYITVRNGRFTGDADGKRYDDHKLCDQCVK